MSGRRGNSAQRGRGVRRRFRGAPTKFTTSRATAERLAEEDCRAPQGWVCCEWFVSRFRPSGRRPRAASGSGLPSLPSSKGRVAARRWEVGARASRFGCATSSSRDFWCISRSSRNDGCRCAGYSSLYDLCVRYLGMSEGQAHHSVSKAHPAKSIPSRWRWSPMAGKSDILIVLARWFPKPDVPDQVKPLRTGGKGPAPGSS